MSFCDTCDPTWSVGLTTENAIYVLFLAVAVIIDLETCLQCAPFLNPREGFKKAYNILFLASLTDAFCQTSIMIATTFWPNTEPDGEFAFEYVMDIATSVFFQMALLARYRATFVKRGLWNIHIAVPFFLMSTYFANWYEFIAIIIGQFDNSTYAYIYGATNIILYVNSFGMSVRFVIVLLRRNENRDMWRVLLTSMEVWFTIIDLMSGILSAVLILASSTPTGGQILQAPLWSISMRLFLWVNMHMIAATTARGKETQSDTQTKGAGMMLGRPSVNLKGVSTVPVIGTAATHGSSDL